MANLKDIARLTGRSVSTVSVVLRGDSKQLGICEETEKEIRDAARRLGYVKNDFARTMASGKSRMIAFLVSRNKDEEYTGRLLSGVLETVSAAQYSMRLIKDQSEKPEEFIKNLLSQQIRGLLISGDLPREQVDALIRECAKNDIFCTTVNLSNQVEGAGIISDDINGMKMLVLKMFELGHRKIAMLDNSRNAEYVLTRRNGYLLGMDECGLEPYLIPESKQKKNLLKTLIRQGYTALLTNSDYCSAELMQQAYAQGIRIPDEISICGYSGIKLADYSALPVTTVIQDFEGMGKKAAEILISQVEKRGSIRKGTVKNIALPTMLKIQKSTRAIKEGERE